MALATAASHAEPPGVDARELPRFSAVEPAQALETFKVKHGFHLELVAAEPLVVDPIAVCFDEDSRMFALEMRDYPEQREVQPHLGRVRLLEDTDGDGRCDQAAVFAEDLAWPTALIWANGGLFVCAAPDILWLKDTDGDGRADVREVVFTGFNSGLPRLNVQQLPNCFAWGPDNRIHLQTGGGNRGVIRCLQRADLPPQELAGCDFWFDPRTLEFGFEAGGGQYGMSYDDAGQRFVCNNSDHLRAFLFDIRYAARNPFFALPSPLASVAADGGAAEVFRLSPDEPWRVVRTRWRVAGRVPGLVEGGGRVSGYFTGATGTTVYRGDAFGAEFSGNTFTGDAGGNLVHRKRLRADGVSVIGERPADEKGVEFVASHDTWFRPVNFANAPDGTLYLCDMYREVIEHPWSIPQQIKEHLDLKSAGRGRIWRIAPDGFKPRAAPRLGRASTAGLVAALAHPNGWHRDTATRLLCERRDAAAAPLLEKLLVDSASWLGRLHALRALDGIDALSPATLRRALDDSGAAVREHAVRLCEKSRRDGRMPDALWTKLCAMTADAAPRVRLQLAFTLGEGAASTEALAALAARDAADPWIRAALVSAPPSLAGPLFSRLAADAAFVSKPDHEAILVDLAGVIGAANDARATDAVVDWATAGEPRFAILASLGKGLNRANVPTEGKFAPAFARAREVLSLARADAGERAAAARLLAFDRSEASREALLAVLGRGCPESLAADVFDALVQFPAAAVSPPLLGRWPEFDASLRAHAARFFASSEPRALALLGAIEANAVAGPDVPAAEAARLRNHQSAAVASLAARLLPKPATVTREALIRRYEPALALAGDAANGRQIFHQRCASCHRFRGEGHLFGPDLESVSSGGKEKVLTHLLDPNREIAPNFAAYVAELTDGTTMSGIIVSETPDTVLLREPLGRESAIPRARISRLQTTGRSPMPEGLEAGLEVQDVADLLDHLSPPARQ
ncbi:MAG: hypothetical protein QOE70_100 [Chthoniobacter sp.]|nr:hypothetical protein [Chthoniobacter sp.]